MEVDIMGGMTLKAEGLFFKKATGTKTVGTDTIHIGASRSPFSNGMFQVFVEDGEGKQYLVAQGRPGDIKAKMGERFGEVSDLLGFVAAAVDDKQRPSLSDRFSVNEILVLNALAGGPKTLAQLAKCIGCSPKSAMRGASELEAGYCVSSEKNGSEEVYSLTEGGARWHRFLKEQGPRNCG
jgi:hypothetical protein